MKLKILSSLVLLFALHCRAQSKSFVTNLVAAPGLTTSLTVSNGQVAKIVSAAGSGLITLNVAGYNFTLTEIDNGLPNGGPLILAGSATITLHSISVSSAALCTVELVCPSPPSGAFTPSTAVVIPADSGGPVTIILESSTDLVNWTAALPGTYGTSTTNRFFRVRATR